MSLFTALAPAAARTSQRGRSLAGTIAGLGVGLGVAAALVIAPAAGGSFSAGAALTSPSSSTAGPAQGSGVVVAGGFEWGAPGRH
ncbi:hypothetical protein [Terrabacter sp. 2RAF25]|uniref:hypothetical protein n=1 Tax=Terrabacter sp. 2RAF25 TaxID=3232998 RepID=UPI003F967A5F